MKVKQPIAPNVNQAANAGAVQQVKADATAQQPSKAQALQTPMGPGKKAEPFIGAQLAGQLSRIPQLKGQDIDAGNVAYTKKLGAADDRFDKFAIFFEAETKMCPIDDAEVPQIKAKVLAAGDSGKFSGILPAGYKGKFENWGVKWDRANSRSGADFHDVYSDDKNASAAKANSSVRVRKIGDTQDGKFEVKLPGANIQGSAVLGRFEVATSIGPTRRSKEDVLAEARKGEIDNPATMLSREIPTFDWDTLEDKVQVDDIRHQLVLMDETGKDMFLVTLDFVHATRVATGKEGDFVEFEVERMDGSTSAAGLSELIEIENLLAKSLGLTKSPANKYVRSMMVTE
jgi:hypothetical protein